MISRGSVLIPPKHDRCLTERKLTIELLLGALTAVSLLASYTHQLGGPEMVMISMTTLAIFYFLSGYLTPDVEAKPGAIASKAFSIACSVCVIGLMFSILKYEGAVQLIVIGTTSLAISGLVLAGYAVSSGLRRLVPLLLRVVIIGGIFGVLKFT